MLDYLAVYLNYKRGENDGVGGLPFIIGFMIFLLLFKPIVWLLKLTGVFSVLQWIGLIDSAGDFSFEAAFVMVILLVVAAVVISVASYIISAIVDFLVYRR